MKIFKSKVAKVVYFIVFGCPLILILLAFRAGVSFDERLSLILIALALFLLLFSVVWSISYEFEEDHLVLSLWFYRKTIAYSSLEKVTIGNHYLFAGLKISSAWKGTLMLGYNIKDKVLVSPRDLEDFLSELQMRAPHIEIDYK